MIKNVVLSIQDVCKHYEAGLVQALKGVQFEVSQGEFLVIMGPSGSGKSTLLHLLGGLDTPSSGTIEFFGQKYPSVNSLESVRRERIGFVFQLHHLIPTLTLTENVALPSLPLKLPRQERRKKARALLERVGLGHRVDFLPVKVSGGERQRAAVARSLMNDPELLLADEPTGSVDTETSEEILGFFRESQRERDLTVVMITHNEKVAAKADRLIRIVDGLIQETRQIPPDC